MRVDVIIPAYRAHETISRTLASIACQTIITDLRVTIVNDCDETDYRKEVSLFSDLMDIQEICLDKNGGPGVARQYGLDNTSNPLVTFIDADDTFAGAYALHLLRKGILADPTFISCIGAFVEEQPNTYLLHNQDLVWMFGKMYKRDFLDRYKIRFHESSRANEDNGFNTIMRLVSSDLERINFIQDTVYYWHSTENSITRINNCQYSYDQSFVGYAENMSYAVKCASRQKPFNGAIKLWTAQIMCQLYEYYIETIARAPKFSQQNLEACRKYYNESFKVIETELSPEIFAQIYSEVMQNANAGRKLLGIIPSLSIFEFLDKLRGKE